MIGKSKGSRIVGLDSSHEMLEIAKTKASEGGFATSLEFVEADATALPFPDASFDAAAVGWGLRNVPDLDATLRELVRVTRSGGKIVSIDMGHPPFPLVASAYWLFSGLFVPAVGRAVAGNLEAYRYLHESAKLFIDQRELARRFRELGLVEVRVRNFMFGAVALVEGRKPATARLLNT
ncbi:MAG: class I SAM-dependent methyltransferase, partial [Spirochaetota bacterium]